MTKKEIQDFNAQVSGLISRGRIRKAIALMRQASEQIMMWELTERINGVEQNYNYMLNYLLDGIADPGRPAIYSRIAEDLHTCSDIIARRRLMNEEPTLYYNTLRVLMRGASPSLSARLASYASLARPERAVADADMFKHVWVTFPLNNDDIDAIRRVVTDRQDIYPAHLRVLVAAALSLGQMEYFEESRFDLILDAYMLAEDPDSADETDMYISSIALCSLLFSLIRHKGRSLSPKVKAKFDSVRECRTWSSDIQTAVLEFIRVRDTERINRKMRDELIPNLMKIKPDLLRKIDIKDTDIIDLHSLSDNPEWEDMLRSSGLEEKMREFSEIQQDGGDVFMGTFAHLKNFPFFHEISNWMLPFDADVAQLDKAFDDETRALSRALGMAPFLCDSDKYSFLLSLSMLPENQRAMMKAQIDQQAENIAEAASASEASMPHNRRRRATNRYLKNLYRFHKLFRRKGEFPDPFAAPINPVDIPVISDDFTDGEKLAIIAELYFKFRQHSDALLLFDKVDELLPPDASRYQKMGYCHETMNNPASAIDYYDRAEILDPSSQWTMRRIASCSRVLKDYPRAIRYYKMLQDIHPDDLSIALMLGYVYTEAKMYTDAVGQFYKVEFLDPDSQKAWRGLAWTLFLTGDFDAASRYYAKILQDKPTAEDYLNMGHVSLATGNMRDAVNYYRLSISAGATSETAVSSDSADRFIKLLDDDTPALRTAGVDTSVLPMIIDAVLY